jgi:hypothetical protein
MRKYKLIDGKLPNGRWRWSGWAEDEYVIIRGDRCFWYYGEEILNEDWMQSSELKYWTRFDIKGYYETL